MTTTPLVIQDVPLDEIERNPRQPRATFNEDRLAELAESIKAVGVLEPIVVRPVDRPTRIRYQLVMGERRLRATKLAGLATIPAVIRETANEHLLRDALLENVLREDLTPLEEAAAYEQLRLEHDGNQRELAELLKVSQSKLSKRLSLLALPDEVRDGVDSGRITIERGERLARLPESALDAIAFGEPRLSVDHLLELLDATDDNDTLTAALIYLPEGALEEYTRSRLTAAQVLWLTQLADHRPEAIGELLSATDYSGELLAGEALDRRIEQAILALRVDQLRADLLARGLRVLDDPGEGRGHWTFERVWPLIGQPHADCIKYGSYDHFDLAGDHDGSPCHAIAVCRHAEAVAVCTDPAQHPDDFPLDSSWRRSHAHLFQDACQHQHEQAEGGQATTPPLSSPPAPATDTVDTDPEQHADDPDPTLPVAPTSDKTLRAALKQATTARLDVLANSDLLDPNATLAAELVKLRAVVTPAIAATLDLLLWQTIESQLSWQSAPLACELLCMPEEWIREDTVSGHYDALRRLAATGPADLCLVAIAVTAARMEASLDCNGEGWRWIGPPAVRYLDWLADHANHTLSEVERELVDPLREQTAELQQTARRTA